MERFAVKENVVTKRTVDAVDFNFYKLHYIPF